MKKSYYIGPAVVAFSLALGIFVGGKIHFNDSPERLFSTNSNKDKLNRLMDIIDYEYVDDVNTDSIVDVTVNSILDKLDPHSVYIPRSQMNEVAENMKGDFVGIGINFYKDNYKDTIVVSRTIEGGPSDRAGIEPGDRILMADGDTLFGSQISDEDIVSRLKGKEGSRVNLTVYRRSEKRQFEVEILRDRIPIKSVVAYYLLTPDMGYIKLNRFAESTYKEFKTALTSLKRNGAKKLVLDLRDNPGGYLGIAEQIADEFLPKDKLILFTENKKGQVEKTYATKKGDFENQPVFVLINERSASASEIIAGALQDNDIGTIVGRRSFGKGLVQREMDLGDGSAVRITVSRYFTPTGRSIQKDYTNGSEDYYKKFTQRYRSGELISVDSIKVADSLKFVTPKGKIVYGGGGIIPDVFVPIGTNQSEKIKSMDGLGYYARFIFDHLEKDRSAYKAYTQDSFLTDFKIDDILFEAYIDFMVVRGVNLSYYDYEAQIKLFLKAALAEQLFSPNLKAVILSDSDAMLRKVIELDLPSLSPDENPDLN